VNNAGTSAGAISCWVEQTPARVGGPGESVQSPLVQPGQAVTFTAVVTRLGSTPINLTADCAR
jgi:hypothetical protein